MKIIYGLLILSGSICLVFLLSQISGVLSVSAATFCFGGNCSYVACNTNSDCGTNQFIGLQFCQGNNIYQDYMTFTCNNPGTANANCTNSTVSKFEQSCSSDQFCSYGSCITPKPTFSQNSNPPPIIQNSYNQSYYVKHFRTNCYKNNIYWYDSYGSVQDVYKNCYSDNPCNIDTCSDNQCVNRLKCDGSTCSVNSPDYAKYCGDNNQIQDVNLTVSISGKKESDTQWVKDIDVVNNDKINFLITVKNVSNLPVNNVLVRTDIGDSVEYMDNLKINDSPSIGNIIYGIDLGIIYPNILKTVSFNGLIKAEDIQNKKSVKITSVINYGNMYNTDFLTVNIEPGQNKVNIAPAALTSSSITNLSKKWYFWMIIAVLVFLFVIIFRKLSSRI